MTLTCRATCSNRVTTERRSEWLTLSGLLVLRDVGRDPVDDVLLLAAGEL
jgi:hypothetical protein